MVPQCMEGAFNGVSPIHADAEFCISSASHFESALFNEDFLNLASEDAASLSPVPSRGLNVLHPILADHAWSSPSDHVWGGCLQKLLSLQTNLFTPWTHSFSKTQQEGGIEWIASMTQQLMDVFPWHSQLCPGGSEQTSCTYYHRADFMTLLVLVCYLRLLQSYMDVISLTNIPTYHDSFVSHDCPAPNYCNGASATETLCSNPLTTGELRGVAGASIFGHLLNRLTSSAQCFIGKVSNSIHHKCCPVGSGIALSITPMLTAVTSLEKPLRLRLNRQMHASSDIED
ncbi:hypothetical protein BDV26DRAFT_288603 [Aspergillus bertholletiae]|uniref:Uncharacterized protein n=1 Tax=Aspergillus bertholletiae TaxID=1226010 RepID=A0A5N7BLE2_9EURO|nr:hypothetical protein BDV26DRAFT_288603 [Aspergillus bertholletiae]